MISQKINFGNESFLAAKRYFHWRLKISPLRLNAILSLIDILWTWVNKISFVPQTLQMCHTFHRQYQHENNPIYLELENNNMWLHSSYTRFSLLLLLFLIDFSSTETAKNFKNFPILLRVFLASVRKSGISKREAQSQWRRPLTWTGKRSIVCANAVCFKKTEHL